MKAQARQNILILALAQSVLLASIGTSMANLALPAISADLGVDFSQARWVVISYLLATTAFSVVAGRFADRRGRRLTLILGTALFAAGTSLACAAFSFRILVFARAVQGLGAAALVALPIVIASEAVPADKTGRTLGLLATMSAVGTASGPSLGGLILASYGWRPVFLMMTAVAILNLALLVKFVRLKETSVTTTGTALSLREAAQSAYGDSHLRTHLIFNLAVSAVMMCTLIVGPFYLSIGLHLNPIYAGLVMTAGPVTSAFCGLFSGMAVDRVGSRRVMAFGFLQLLIGTVSFVCLPSWLGAIGFAISAVLLSLGYQLFLTANSSSIMASSPAQRRGLASGALSLSRNLGLMFGASVLGGVFDHFAAETGDLGTASALHGLQATFLCAAILIAVSFITYLVTEQRRKIWSKIPCPSLLRRSGQSGVH